MDLIMFIEIIIGLMPRNTINDIRGEKCGTYDRSEADEFTFLVWACLNYLLFIFFFNKKAYIFLNFFSSPLFKSNK